MIERRRLKVWGVVNSLLRKRGSVCVDLVGWFPMSSLAISSIALIIVESQVIRYCEHETSYCRWGCIDLHLGDSICRKGWWAEETRKGACLVQKEKGVLIVCSGRGNLYIQWRWVSKSCGYILVFGAVWVKQLVFPIKISILIAFDFVISLMVPIEWGWGSRFLFNQW